MILDFSYAEILSIAVSALCVLVTLLTGWNIAEVIRARAYRKSLDKKINDIIKDYRNYTDANISFVVASIALRAPKKTQESALGYYFESLDSSSKIKENFEEKYNLINKSIRIIEKLIKDNKELEVTKEEKERVLQICKTSPAAKELINLINNLNEYPHK